MKHSIRIDSVVTRVAALVSVDGTADVAAVLQNIIPLERDGQSVALQERLGHLRVPKQFVGVHAGRGETATAVLTDVGGEGQTIVEYKVHLRAITESPRFHVVGRHHRVARVGIRQAAVDTGLKPVFAIAESHTLAEVKRIRRSLFIRIFAGRVVHKADAMCVSHTGREVQSQIVVAVKPRIETGVDIAIPIAIDILGLRFPHTRVFMISDAVGRAVANEGDISSDKDETLVIHLETVIVKIEVVREGRLQSRITIRDIQGVGVVANVKQAGHAGLRRTTAVGESHIGLLVEIVAEIHVGSEVEHIACHCRVLRSHVFVVQRASLWKKVDARAEIEIVRHLAEA